MLREQTRTSKTLKRSAFAISTLALICLWGALLTNAVYACLAIVAVGAALVFLVPPADAIRVRLLYISTIIFTFSSLLPRTANLVLQAALLLAGYGYWFSQSRLERRGTMVVSSVTLVLIAWAILMFHPNVPNLSIGLAGFRKTAYPLAGLVLGCSIRTSAMKSAALDAVGYSIFLALCVSIVSHLYVPSIEDLVSRNADTYTASIDGVSRMQGVFAGPFHAALAACVLIAWGMYKYQSNKLLSFLAVGVGLFAIYLTYVRTSYVALLVIVLIYSAVAPTVSRRVSRTAALASIAIIGIVAINFGDPAVLSTADSIGSFASDGRFLNRFPQYALGLQYVFDSPLIGWGAGSAGDTLSDYFTSGLKHVNPHNLFLKVAVEGGVIGLSCWGIATASVLKSVKWRSSQGQLAAMSLAALVTFGVTISSIEAMPISFLIFFVAGIAALSRPLSTTTTTDFETRKSVV